MALSLAAMFDLWFQLLIACVLAAGWRARGWFDRVNPTEDAEPDDPAPRPP